MESIPPEDSQHDPLPTLDYASPPPAIPTRAGCVLIAWVRVWQREEPAKPSP